MGMDISSLLSQLQAVQETSGKQVLIAETSYAYTLKETDGTGNTVQAGNNDVGDDLNYPFSVQGQASFLRALMAAVQEAGGVGVFYWEPVWITVGDVSALTGRSYTAQVNKNKTTWETHGSGWASSF